MMNRRLIDTDVLVDYLRDNPLAVKYIETNTAKSEFYLSAITVSELYAGVREGKEKHIMDQFLRAFKIVSVDETIAQAGGLYRRDYGKSHGVGLADAIIAASAESVEAKLVTLNKKHYPMIKDLITPYSKS